ncbi:MAG: aminotransferase-like domain-containing protein, partial [Eubacteriales bacterium]
MEINIKLDRQNMTPLYLQIAKQIIEHINLGTLREGGSLPPERKFAAILGVNRSTVINAYRDLEARGFVSSHVGKGTLVNARQPRHDIDYFGWQELLSGQGESLLNAYNYTMAELLSPRDLIAMDTGVAAPELYPKDEFAKLCKEILLSEADVVLQYNCAQGLKSLRESLVSLMEVRSIQTDPDDIIVLNGSQEGLDLISRILLEPGDCVIVEQPTFLGAIDIFRAYGVKFIGIPVDNEGMIVSRLENVLNRVRPKLIYTIPTFQNPATVCMSLERRRQLMELANRYHVPVLEDDAYGLLYYGDPPPPSLKS